jgi:hypothetical protein
LYGRRRRVHQWEKKDKLLDRFMPNYEVAERHHIQINASADIVFRMACETNVFQSPMIVAIFRARELLLRSQPHRPAPSTSFIAWMKSLGWGVLDETPGREIVMGAATRPWEADVVFRTLPPGEFSSFREPDYVKIAWTIRAEPIDPSRSELSTETRVATTDSIARAKFRWYWAFFSPGIVLIRWLVLPQLRRSIMAREHGHHFATSK